MLVLARGNRHPRACDKVRTLLGRCARGALRDVILGVVAIGRNTPVRSLQILVIRSVVLLEVDPKLLVVHERLVLPRDVLLSVQQSPPMVARRKSSHVRAEIAGWIALRQQILPRLCRAAPGLESNRFASREVLDHTGALPKRRGRERADAHVPVRSRCHRQCGCSGSLVEGKDGSRAHSVNNLEGELSRVKAVVVFGGAVQRSGEDNGAGIAGHDIRDHLDTTGQHSSGCVVTQLVLRHVSTAARNHNRVRVWHEGCAKADAKPVGGRALDCNGRRVGGRREGHADLHKGQRGAGDLLAPAACG
mmetsp:Transcript_11907/g.30601  ORF Transcript_11907/g.30601 Transcript_11907/m.30601 type:complete len:305 (+) Transcript_11907:559-1473(+)